MDGINPLVAGTSHLTGGESGNYFVPPTREAKPGNRLQELEIVGKPSKFWRKTAQEIIDSCMHIWYLRGGLDSTEL